MKALVFSATCALFFLLVSFSLINLADAFYFDNSVLPNCCPFYRGKGTGLRSFAPFALRGRRGSDTTDRLSLRRNISLIMKKVSVPNYIAITVSHVL